MLKHEVGDINIGDNDKHSVNCTKLLIYNSKINVKHNKR